MVELVVARLALLSQNLTHYGDLEKNFKFLKEVKILSNFVQSKLACPMPIYVSGRRATTSSACHAEAKNIDSIKRCGIINEHHNRRISHEIYFKSGLKHQEKENAWFSETYADPLGARGLKKTKTKGAL